MATSKRAFLLMEALVALFILAIITIPWITFLRTEDSQSSLTQIDRFFLTKRYFLEALNTPTIMGPYFDQLGEIRIIRSKRPDGLIALQVNLIEKGQTTVSLVGVTR